MKGFFCKLYVIEKVSKNPRLKIIFSEVRIPKILFIEILFIENFNFRNFSWKLEVDHFSKKI